MKHAKGFESSCNPPYLSWRWKLGQVWACECGNLFRVVERCWGAECVRDWELLEKGGE